MLIFGARRINRQFARRHHFTTTTRILQDFASSCKLGLFLLNKPPWLSIFNIKGKKKRIVVEVVKGCHHAMSH